MTKADIMRMARDCDLGRVCGPLDTLLDYEWENLQRFANLVAAAEREACAKVCEDEAWRLKKLAVDTNSSSTNTKAIQASNDSDSIRARTKP